MKISIRDQYRSHFLCCNALWMLFENSPGVDLIVSVLPLLSSSIFLFSSPIATNLFDLKNWSLLVYFSIDL